VCVRVLTCTFFEHNNSINLINAVHYIGMICDDVLVFVQVVETHKQTKTRTDLYTHTHVYIFVATADV
jgi:hypothetical protein